MWASGIESVEILETSRKSTIYFRGKSGVGTGMTTRAAQLVAKCEYCGKRLVMQDKNGESVDGNRIVLEADGSRRRACKSCAEELSQGLHGMSPEARP